jgi:hypothetical protein
MLSDVHTLTRARLYRVVYRSEDRHSITSAYATAKGIEKF